MEDNQATLECGIPDDSLEQLSQVKAEYAQLNSSIKEKDETIAAQKVELEEAKREIAKLEGSHRKLDFSSQIKINDLQRKLETFDTFKSESAKTEHQLKEKANALQTKLIVGLIACFHLDTQKKSKFSASLEAKEKDTVILRQQENCHTLELEVKTLEDSFQLNQQKCQMLTEDYDPEKWVKSDMKTDITRLSTEKQKLERDNEDLNNALQEKLRMLAIEQEHLKTAKMELEAFHIERDKATKTLKSKEQELKEARDELEQKARSEGKQKETFLRRQQETYLNLDLEVNRFKGSLVMILKENEIEALQDGFKLNEVESVPRAVELQKCRDELRATTAERDQLKQTIARQQTLDQQFRQLKDQLTQSLGQVVHDNFAKVAADIRMHEDCVGMPDLNYGVPRLYRQSSTTSSALSSLAGQQPFSGSLSRSASCTEEESVAEGKSGVSRSLTHVKQQLSNYSLVKKQCHDDSYERTTTEATWVQKDSAEKNMIYMPQRLTLQKLMPYIPDLADRGSRIAGYLNMQKQWDSLALSHLEVVDRLQKLFSVWLEGEEDRETPHTWAFFINLVRMKGIDQHQLAKTISSNNLHSYQ